MPSIPQYTSKERVTTEPGISKLNVNPGAGEALERSGEMLSILGEKMRKIGNANAECSADIAIKEWELVDSDKRSKEPDLNKALIDIEDAKRKSTNEIAKQNFSDPIGKQEFLRKQELLDAGYVIQQKASVYKKQAELGRVNLLTKANLRKEEAYDVPLADLPETLDKIKADLTEGVELGIFDPVDVEKEYSKIVEDVRQGRPQKAIYDDPSTQEEDSQVLKELKKGSGGEYANLTHEERTKAIKESQQRIFNNNQRFKREVEVSQHERNTGVIDKLATGNLTLGDIEAEYKIPEDQGGIPRATLLQYQKGIMGGVKADLTLMLNEKIDKKPTERARLVKQYNELIDYYIDDKVDQWKAKEALAEAWKDGSLNPKEAKLLDPLKKDLKDIEFNRSKSLFVGAIKNIKKWTKQQSNATDEDLAVNIKQLLNGVAKGGEPDVVVKQILSDNMKTYFPDYVTYPKEGRIKEDKKSGRTFKVFPDGTWTWATEKKTETK